MIKEWGPQVTGRKHLQRKKGGTSGRAKGAGLDGNSAGSPRAQSPKGAPDLIEASTGGSPSSSAAQRYRKGKDRARRIPLGRNKSGLLGLRRVHGNRQGEESRIPGSNTAAVGLEERTLKKKAAPAQEGEK